MAKAGVDSILPQSAGITGSVTIGPRVILAGDGIVVRDHDRLDAACIIGEGVTIGRGAWVRPGAVVLRSVPANAIVEGDPATDRGPTSRIRLRDGTNRPAYPWTTHFHRGYPEAQVAR